MQSCHIDLFSYMPVWGMHRAKVLPTDPLWVLKSSSYGHSIWKVELEMYVQTTGVH